MEQILSVWSKLTPQRRIVVVLATIAMFAAVLGLAQMATRPGMTLLYAGLEDGAAGEVIQALETRGISYDVRGSSIFVDSAARDQLRLTLASEGLPSNPTQGYELLDQLTGFGTTSQMFDAAYWRAKEGELARTIVNSPSIQNARVHIANPGTKPFQRDLKPTASVTVTPSGGGIAPSHAQALRYLVASAVAGLSPEDVSVIDANGGVILSSDASSQSPGQSMDKAAALKRNVERLLEARVGYGNAVVEVNVDTVTEREQIVERIVDPGSRVAISQETTQSSTSSSDNGGGDVTVASNLPDGDAATNGDSSRSQESETRERVNYEISETQREVLRTPGAVARITTAVLIDGIEQVGADGTVTWGPRPDEEMEALRELVASAVGYNADRGDTLTIKTLQFEPLPEEGSAPGAALAGAMTIDAMRLAQLGILGLVTLLLGVFVLRPIMAGRSGAPALANPGASDLPPLLAGGGLDGEIDPADAPMGRMQVLPNFASKGSGEESPVDRLRALIDERQEESLEILRSWMEDDGEKV